MPNSLGKEAVVMGAGMGGLTAAKALSAHFDCVTVLDRDALPEGPAPRQGTPQARHAHVLLAAGQQALAALFPGERPRARRSAENAPGARHSLRAAGL